MHRDIVVIGGSAGAWDPLYHLAGRLQAGFPAAILGVLHIAPSSKGEFARLLGRIGPLPCGLAEDGQPIEPGRILLAPPDHHLIVASGSVRVAHGPKENFARPAIDPLFRSAAEAYGPRVIGVILSGYLDDGAQGLAAVKRAGGIAIVQDPKDARHPDMPMHATLAADPDYRTPAAGMPGLLERLVREPAEAADQAAREARSAEIGASANRPLSGADLSRLGKPSVFTCPDCGGTLFEIDDAGLLRYRCSTGHGYGLDSLAAGKDAGVEAALYAALRALQESERLTRRLRENLRESEFPLTRQELQAKSVAQIRHAQAIRALLNDLGHSHHRPEAPEPESNRGFDSEK